MRSRTQAATWSLTASPSNSWQIPQLPELHLNVVKVKGLTVSLGGTEYVVPPLSLGALEQFQDSLANFTGDITDKKQIGTIADCAHAALRRNYPALTREEVADMIGLENMMEVMEAVMDISGLKRKSREASDGEGEAPPVA